MKNGRILAVHLLNDFSGSPFVLRQSLEALVAKGYSVTLYTATPGGEGFLSNIKGVKLRPLYYRWHRNRWVTLFLFLYSQVFLFFCLLRDARKTDTVYINSLLPFGAALGAVFKGARVLYHIHEVSVKPAMLKALLLKVAGFAADRIVYVSEDLKVQTGIDKPAEVVYNTLPQSFIQKAITSLPVKHHRFTVLMICSLKKYKGVDVFAEAARRLPAFSFRLVLNASQPAIDAYFSKTGVPPNLEIFPSQSDVHPFYASADLVVNLSLPDGWIETFGMTILEAMYYRKPVLIPEVGGITELVTNGQEGFRVNSYRLDELCGCMRLLATSPSLYEAMSAGAFQKACHFTPLHFNHAIIRQVEMVSRKGNLVEKELLLTQPSLF